MSWVRVKVSKGEFYVSLGLSLKAFNCHGARCKELVENIRQRYVQIFL